MASLIFGATLVTAAPAQAWVPDCTLGRAPQATTVYIENGEIRINPSGPSSDVAAFRAWVTDYVNCWRNESGVAEVAACITGHGVGGPYVYEDPYTGEYVVAYDALLDHARSMSECVATT